MHVGERQDQNQHRWRTSGSNILPRLGREAEKPREQVDECGLLPSLSRRPGKPTRLREHNGRLPAVQSPVADASILRTKVVAFSVGCPARSVIWLRPAAKRRVCTRCCFRTLHHPGDGSRIGRSLLRRLLPRLHLDRSICRKTAFFIKLYLPLAVFIATTRRR